MSLFKWLMLIAAISLTESLIIFKGRSQQTSTLPQVSTNHTTKMNKEESSLQPSRMKRKTEETLKKFINITQAIPIKTVYIPVRMHQFNKMIPFQQVYTVKNANRIPGFPWNLSFLIRENTHCG
jgi:hypothetical protein